MLRHDFVSNSSSTSYIVTIPSTYSIKDFINSVSKNCSRDKEELIPDLLERNIATLSYHIYNSRLLFLGSVYVKDHDFIIDRDKCPEYEEQEYHREQFDDLKKRIKNKGKDNKMSEYDTDYEILNDTQIKLINHIHVSNIITDRYDSIFNDLNYIKKSKDVEWAKKLSENVKEHLDQLLKLKTSSDGYWWLKEPYDSDIFVIDKNTVLMTEYMLEHGYDIDFEKHEKLKKIKKLLEENNSIVCIRIATSGDGMEANYIYKTSDKNAFENVPVTFLFSEYL